MTSPTQQPKAPLSERLTRRVSSGRSARTSDPEERFTRNVTLAFVAVIVIAAIFIVFGLIYGFWDANLKPLASVDGTQIGRGAWEDRQRLEAFRNQRAEQLVRGQLAEASINEDLADRRLQRIAAEGQALPSAAMESLVDLTFQAQLAAERGISVSDEEIEAALAADGSSPEARRVSALVIRSPEEEVGRPATPEGRAEAQARAAEAMARIEAGETIADLAEEFSPITAPEGGDLGYLERADISDAAWADALFALEVGGTTGLIEGEGGELLISQVTDIVPEGLDAGFRRAVASSVGEEAHRRNVELETIARKLEAQVADEARNEELAQVRLAEILIAGDPIGDAADDEGDVRVSHILYAPGDPEAAAPAEDDPAWDEAQALADAAAAELRAIEDADARIEAFAARAIAESDDTSSAAGGDLGFFGRGAMVPEFDAAVFDAEDPQRGDILGPVRSPFGWHVIMFDERRPPLAERLAAVETALAAPDADFAAIAREHSDGAEAFEGGETGWHVVDDLDELSAIAIDAIEVGDITEAVEGDAGYTIYKKLDEGVRPLDEAEAARAAGNAFLEWYEEQRFEAEDEGRISIDGAVFQGEQAAAIANRG